MKKLKELFKDAKFTRCEAVIITLLAAADIASKHIMKAVLAKGPVKVFPFFWLNYVENTGGAFGMLQNRTAWFLVFTLVLLIAMLISKGDIVRHGKYARAGFLLIMAGAIGNFVDRVFLGYVIDFLDFRVWPVFNFADSYICIGVALAGFALVFVKPGQPEKI